MALPLLACSAAFFLSSDAVTHLLGSLSSRHRGLLVLEDPVDLLPVKRVVRGGTGDDELCVSGGVTYADLAREGYHVPTPSCADISVLGHLVSDGHGRLAHEEVWLREHVTRVRVEGLWQVTRTRQDVWDWTLAAGRGYVEEVCLNATTWTVPSVSYYLSQRVVPGRADSVADATIVWASRWATVLEGPEKDGVESGWLPATWSVRLSALLADVPGVTLLSRVTPGFYTLTSLLRGLVVVSGRIQGLPNPVLAPCSVHAEDAEVRIPWEDWVRVWPDVYRLLSDTGASLIAKSAQDPHRWREDGDDGDDGGTRVAILDLQLSVGREETLDALVEDLCALVSSSSSRCVVHLGKSASPARAAHTLATYYAGVPPGNATTCYHPFCRRGGEAQAYTSARGAAAWWLL